MRKLKLMADYFCWPLWDITPGADEYDLDSDALPISLRLRDDLQEWADRYDTRLNDDDPASTCWGSAAEKLAFENDGRELWRRVQTELEGIATVVYFSVIQQRLID